MEIDNIELVPVVPDYLQFNTEDNETFQDVNQEPEWLRSGDSPEENLEDLEESEDQENENISYDYSIDLQNIIDNQELILSNQNTIIVYQEEILKHLELYDNYVRATSNVLIITIIVVCGFWIAKNIFIKMF